jgi:hypothetical protein
MGSKISPAGPSGPANPDHFNLSVRRSVRGSLMLTGKAVEAAMKPAHWEEFVDRLFSMPHLASVELRRDAGTARLRFERGSGTVPDRLRSLAAAMRNGAPQHQYRLPDPARLDALTGGRPLRLWRAGGRLTFLEVTGGRSGRRRFYHPALAAPSTRVEVLNHLAEIAYVRQPAGPQWAGHWIEAGFEAGRMTLEGLLEAVEGALLATVGAGAGYRAEPLDIRHNLVQSNLALAVVSDFLLPAVRPLSILTLWLLNASHVIPAWRSVLRRKFNLHVLYCSIAFLTLISMHFMESAIMYWMLDFWPRLARRLREGETARLTARMNRRPRSAWVERGKSEVEVELRHLKPGETVILREGDVAPGDGLVLTGSALIEESWSGGLHGRGPGDFIHSSGRVARGELRMRLDTPGAGAATSALARWQRQALDAPVSEERVTRMANATVPITLALTGLALWRGGIPMGKGVIRPDYFTGPALSRSLGWVAAIHEAAGAGLFIRNDAALEKLAQCDCFVFGPGVAWRPGGGKPEEIGIALGGMGVEEVLMPHDTGNGTRTMVIHSMGAGGIGDPRPHDAVALIRERQYFGRRVAFIGDCATHAQAAAQADVPVHVCRPPFDEEPAGAIALIDPGLDGVLALRRIAARFDNRLSGSFLRALVPNAACTAGALYLGLPVIGVILLTNAGTLVSYLEAKRAIRRATA